MEAAYEDSMMKRYLEKEVLEAVVLDDMETDRGWVHSGIGEDAGLRRMCRVGRPTSMPLSIIRS